MPLRGRKPVLRHRGGVCSRDDLLEDKGDEVSLPTGYAAGIYGDFHAACRLFKLRGAHSDSLRSTLPAFPASSLRENLSPPGPSHFPRPWAGHARGV